MFFLEPLDVCKGIIAHVSYRHGAPSRVHPDPAPLAASSDHHFDFGPIPTCLFHPFPYSHARSAIPLSDVTMTVCISFPAAGQTIELHFLRRIQRLGRGK